MMQEDGDSKGRRPLVVCGGGSKGEPIERVPPCGSFPLFCPYRKGVPPRHERKGKVLYNVKFTIKRDEKDGIKSRASQKKRKRVYR